MTINKKSDNIIKDCLSQNQMSFTPDRISEELFAYFQRQKEDLETVYKKYKKQLEYQQGNANYIIELSKLYSFSNFVVNLFVGNFLRSILSFLALYLILNQLSDYFELVVKIFHFREVFPSFDIRFLTVFISLATIVSASAINSKKEAMQKVEERLAQTVVAEIWVKFGEYDLEFEKQRKSMRDFQDSQFKLQADVAGLKADVSSLKADVSELKADVSELKGNVTNINDKIDLLLAAIEAKN